MEKNSKKKIVGPLKGRQTRVASEHQNLTCKIWQRFPIGQSWIANFPSSKRSSCDRFSSLPFIITYLHSFRFLLDKRQHHFPNSSPKFSCSFFKFFSSVHLQKKDEKTTPITTKQLKDLKDQG